MKRTNAGISRTAVFRTALARLSLALLGLLAGVAAAQAQSTGCLDCHPGATMAAGKHATLLCSQCHEGADTHLGAPSDPAVYPRVHFDQEICMGCHAEQYDTFEIESRGMTYYGGSDDSAMPPKGWSKTRDFPYWNVLIDGHPFVLETYEDSPMASNQIEHQETTRPGSEACLECHGTRAAYVMGIEFRDRNGVVRSVPQSKTTVTLPNGSAMDIPGREYVIKYQAHTILDGTSYQEPVTGAWLEAINTIEVPLGTKVWTFTDGVNPSGGATPQKYQVKTVVTLPAPVTVDVLDKFGAVVGQVTFDTVASFPEAGADINGVTGFSSPAAADANVATVARNWIYSSLEALAFDGLDYAMSVDPTHADHFLLDKSKLNWPSVQSGELCNQCHDPHSGKLRIIKKSLIAAIAQRGINPYSATGKDILSFDQASRQDQIIAVCAQCHSEYVGGYSANTRLDQDYFPWAKPADLENQYAALFGNLQDWTHGGPVAPWQSTEANAQGFFPYGQRYVIDAPLAKIQHPEAETFWNSPMYLAGATCTDCHSARLMSPGGMRRYTSHWFTSPLKLMEGFTGETLTGKPVSFAPYNPCTRCHMMESITQSQAKIRTHQDNFSVVQERTQMALVNALKYISEQQAAGHDQSANVGVYRRAAMRWEYYTQAENSMGFHNLAEAVTEVTNARLWLDPIVPWPLTPTQARVLAAGPDSLTLAFFDQAGDETGFVIERAPTLEGPYTQVAAIPSTNGANVGDVQWTDASLVSGTTYFYRVAALNAAGQSVWSIWAAGTTSGAAIPAPSGLTATASGSARIDLTWTDNSADETGFRIERAKDAAFAVELTVLQAAANATAYSDTGLLPETTYYYRAFAVGTAGTSAASNTTSATTAPAPPNAPTGLIVRTTAQTSVTLAWKDNSGNELGFYVERRDGNSTWARIATLGPNTTTYTNVGLSRRRMYSYRIQAYNATGASAYSNIVSTKTR